MGRWKNRVKKHKETTIEKWSRLEKEKQERNRIGNLTGLDFDTGEFLVSDLHDEGYENYPQPQRVGQQSLWDQNQPFMLDAHDKFEAQLIDIVIMYREASRSKGLLDNIRAALTDPREVEVNRRRG